MSTKTMKEKAAELLQKCEVVTLASVNKEGYPRPVPMSKIAAEGISTIWMSTGADSLKTIDFLSNPKAGLCFQEKGDSVDGLIFQKSLIIPCKQRLDKVADALGLKLTIA